jgi:hypothetical protein
MHLKLLPPAPPPSAALSPAPFDLSHRPARPGLAHCELVLALEPSLCEAAIAAAAADAQLVEIWAAWVIESERLLAVLADRGELAEELDRLAARAPASTPGGAVRLREYAAQLRIRSAAPRSAAASGEGEGLVVLVPDASRTAWRRAAIEADLTLDAWVTERLRELPRGRALWEAAAAERGESLAEWILAQAARRRR